MEGEFVVSKHLNEVTTVTVCNSDERKYCPTYPDVTQVSTQVGNFSENKFPRSWPQEALISNRVFDALPAESSLVWPYQTLSCHQRTNQFFGGSMKTVAFHPHSVISSSPVETEKSFHSPRVPKFDVRSQQDEKLRSKFQTQRSGTMTSNVTPLSQREKSSESSDVWLHYGQPFSENLSMCEVKTTGGTGEFCPATTSYTGRNLPFSPYDRDRSVTQSKNLIGSETTGVRPIIKNPKTRTSPTGQRKCVTFSSADLVHVEECIVSPVALIQDLFSPFSHSLDDDVPERSDDLFFREEECAGELSDKWGKGFWFDSSTDDEPYLADLPSMGDNRDCAPLSIVNDFFGRTTIFVSSGTFRPGDSGKLNGKAVNDLSSRSHDHRRTLSTGTLSGIKSNRTLVKVNFVQGLLDINHNPGQTAEFDSKAAQDTDSGISSYKYDGAVFTDASENFDEEGFPRERTAGDSVNKICHKMSHYKFQLIAIVALASFLVSLAIGLGVGLEHLALS